MYFIYDNVGQSVFTGIKFNGRYTFEKFSKENNAVAVVIFSNELVARDAANSAMKANTALDLEVMELWLLPEKAQGVFLS